MSLCVIGAATLRLTATVFTLSWVHSIEHTRWEEDWRVENGSLRVAEARIESTGAGMETPPDARFDGTWWRWTPAVPPLPQLSLRRSDAQPQGWKFCADGVCRAVADAAEKADIVTVQSCD